MENFSIFSKILLPLNAKLLLALIFVIFLFFFNKFIVPLLKNEFKSSNIKIQLLIYKDEQLFIYKKILFLLIGSLILTASKKLNLALVRVNFFFFKSYINHYFYIINFFFFNILNDVSNVLKLRQDVDNLTFLKNSLLNFFISYKLIC